MIPFHLQTAERYLNCGKSETDKIAGSSNFQGEGLFELTVFFI